MYGFHDLFFYSISLFVSLTFCLAPFCVLLQISQVLVVLVQHLLVLVELLKFFKI